MLHLRKPEIISLVKKLLPTELLEHNRKAGILLDESIVPYPFQNNLFHIKNKIIKDECVNGIVEASKNYDQNLIPENFKKWIINSQGKAKYFMIPYNEKCFGVDLGELSLDWLGRFVPQPDLNTILNGSKKDMSRENVGYNYTFFYSQKSGGIDWLPKALNTSNNLNLSESVIKIDLKNKFLITNKRKFKFDKIISTIPINKLVEKIMPTSSEVINAVRNLRCNSISTLLGIDRPSISDLQWMYLPNKEILPYRLSFPMNYSKIWHLMAQVQSVQSFRILVVEQFPIKS